MIGIQSEEDTEFSDVLDAMAEAGGKAQASAAQKYYAARSELELDTALSTIAKQVGTCVFLTASVPDVGGTLELVLDGAVLTETDWTWRERSNGEIVLGAEICRQVLAEETPELVARVTCAEQ